MRNWVCSWCVTNMIIKWPDKLLNWFDEWKRQYEARRHQLRKKFAFLPTRVPARKGPIVWLEFYWLSEEKVKCLSGEYYFWMSERRRIYK